MTFVEFIRDRIGANWVIARPTPRIRAKYGADVVCLSPGRYKALGVEYEKITGLAAHGFPGEPCEPLRMAALELLRALRCAVNTPSRAEANIIAALLIRFKDYAPASAECR